MAKKDIEKEGIRKRFLRILDLIKKQNPAYSDTQAAKDTGMNPSNISEIRNGARSITLHGLTLFKKAHPEISFDYILSNAGTPFLEEKETEKEIIVATEDTSGNTTIPMISYKAAANYLTGYNTQEYFEELPPMSLPSILVRSGQHYALQVVNDSMVPTLYESDWIVCRLLQRSEWKNMRDKYIYVLVTEQKGINVKRIINRLEQHGFIRCKSDNRAYPSYNVEPEDIIQVWEVKLKVSAHLPDQNELLYNKVDRIEEEIENIRGFISQFAKPMPKWRPKGGFSELPEG